MASLCIDTALPIDAVSVGFAGCTYVTTSRPSISGAYPLDTEETSIAVRVFFARALDVWIG